MRYYNNNDLNNLSDNDTELKAIYDKLKNFTKRIGLRRALKV